MKTTAQTQIPKKTNAILFAKTVNHYSMTKKLQQLYSHKARNVSPKWGREAQNLKNQKIVVADTTPKRPSRPKAYPVGACLQAIF